MTSDSPSPRTEAGKRLLAHWADELALIIAKARFGPGVDMGGKHNPRPSERTAAQQFVEDFAAALQEAPAPDGLDAAIERVREYMDAAWDDGRWTYEGLARAALAAPPYPPESACTCACVGCRGHEEF